MLFVLGQIGYNMWAVMTVTDVIFPCDSDMHTRHTCI